MVDAPRPEDFSNRAVARAVFSEAILHPTTLFPAAGALLSGLYMGLVSFDPTSLAVGVGSGLLSLGSWIYHYFVRGEKIAENYIKELKEKRKDYKKQQVEDIEEKCKTAGFTEGQQAARELLEAYTRLYQFLKEKSKKVKSQTAQRFMILAEETYDQGVQFLTKALVLYRALVQIDEEKLIKELRAWQKEVKNREKYRNKEEQKDLVIKVLEEKISSHRKRLELFSERGETLKQLMDQCEVLEATLDSTYLEVVDLIHDDPFFTGSRHDNAASNLERAVSAARKAEDRLRNLGKQQDIDDSIYTKPIER